MARILVLTILCTMLSTLSAQVQPDPQLRKNRTTYHPAMEVLKSRRTRVTDAQLEQLKKYPLETIWASLQGLKYTNCHFSGLQPTRPAERLVGRALTIRYLPRRPDLDEAMRVLAAEGDWPSGYHVRAAEEAKPGDVLVVDLGGGIKDGIFFGDISALGARTAGARGAVLYGSSRDLAELRAMEGFPVFAMGYDPLPASQIGVDWNVPIRFGTVVVLPGDVVVAEEETVLFFPPEITADLLISADRHDRQERYERELTLEKKHRFRDIYPLSPELRKKFEKERMQK